jgi:hypothetical protein
MCSIVEIRLLGDATQSEGPGCRWSYSSRGDEPQILIGRGFQTAIFLDLLGFKNYRYSNHLLKKCWRFGNFPNWHIILNVDYSLKAGFDKSV